MRILLQSVLVCLAMPCAAQDLFCKIRWPDPNIPVPSLVRSYILEECDRYRGFSEETVNECLVAESYGYRAVVTMLSDPETGETAAERYRQCAAGLGDLGGRFHRRKAECIGSILRIIWRFEFSREATAGEIRFATLRGPATSGPSLIPGSPG